jgi:hypothetical protein
MNSPRSHDRRVANVLCALSVILGALMVGLFLAGCETQQLTRADPNSVIQKQDDNGHVHGQVDAMYGFGR